MPNLGVSAAAGWLDRNLTPTRLKTYGTIIAVGIITAVVLAISLPERFPTNDVNSRTIDFLTFYNAGKLVNDGRPLDVYSYRQMATLVFAQLGHPPPNLATFPDDYPVWPAFAYAPPTTLALALLAKLPFGLALTCWLIALLAALLLAFYLLRLSLPLLRRYPLWLALLLGLSFWPLDISIINGQTTSLNILLLAAAYYFSRPGGERWEWLVGLCAAFFALEKPQLALALALIWLLNRQWRIVAWLALSVSLAVGVSLLFLPASVYSAWLNMVAAFGSYSAATVNANEAATLRITLLTYLPALVGTLIYLLFLGVALVALVWAMRRLQQSSLIEARKHMWLYILAVLFMVVTSSYLIYYDLALLLIPILLVLGLYDQPHERVHIQLKLITLLIYATLGLIYPLLGLGVRLTPLIILAYVSYVGYQFVQDTAPNRVLTLVVSLSDGG